MVNTLTAITIGSWIVIFLLVCCGVVDFNSDEDNTINIAIFLTIITVIANILRLVRRWRSERYKA